MPVPVSHFKLRGNWVPARALVCALHRMDAVFVGPSHAVVCMASSGHMSGDAAARRGLSMLR